MTLSETSADGTPSTKIKPCTGQDLPFDADVRIGKLGEKKTCEHYEKTKVGDFLLASVDIKLFKDCSLLHTTRRIEGDESTKENDNLVFQLGMGKKWMKALNMGMKKMCKGEKRRITAPAKYGYGELADIENGKKIHNNATLIIDVELFDVTEDPPSSYINQFTDKPVTASQDPVGTFHQMRKEIKRMELTSEYDPEWFERSKAKYDELVERVNILEEEFTRGKEAREERVKAAKEALNEL